MRMDTRQSWGRALTWIDGIRFTTLIGKLTTRGFFIDTDKGEIMKTDEQLRRACIEYLKAWWRDPEPSEADIDNWRTSYLDGYADGLKEGRKAGLNEGFEQGCRQRRG